MKLRTGKRGLFWGCSRYGACRGTHSADQSTGSPHGISMEATAREARLQAHRVFDGLWQGGKMSREEAYLILSRILGISPERCHFGRFSVAQCRLALMRLQTLGDKVYAMTA